MLGGFPGLGDDFFQINLQNRGDTEQGVQGRPPDWFGKLARLSASIPNIILRCGRKCATLTL
jgi:hypothetical protein